MQLHNARAFSSIFDANITTLIKVIILYAVGTGAIKGFAITTGIGVATSMFTAIVGTRAIVNLLYGGNYLKLLTRNVMHLWLFCRPGYIHQDQW